MRHMPPAPNVGMPESVFIDGLLYNALANKPSPDAADSPAPAIAMMFFDEANVSQNAVNMASEGTAVDYR